jgi:hypothetical protein
VPRQDVRDVAPADDPAPAAAAPPAPITPRGDTEDLVLVREARGVIVAREEND